MAEHGAVVKDLESKVVAIKALGLDTELEAAAIRPILARIGLIVKEHARKERITAAESALSSKLQELVAWLHKEAEGAGDGAGPLQLTVTNRESRIMEGASPQRVKVASNGRGRAGKAWMVDSVEYKTSKEAALTIGATWEDAVLNCAKPDAEPADWMVNSALPVNWGQTLRKAAKRQDMVVGAGLQGPVVGTGGEAK